MMSYSSIFWKRDMERFKANYKRDIGEKTCSVPGNICDTTHQCFEKFDKWYKLPTRAHLLYWRLHK